MSEEPRSSMWDLAGSAGCRAGGTWPVLADIHQHVSLAAQMGCQMQLHSPRSTRPPRVTVGATGVTGVPDLNAFGLPPLQRAVNLCTTQSVQQVLHHAVAAAAQLPLEEPALVPRLPARPQLAWKGQVGRLLAFGAT